MKENEHGRIIGSAAKVHLLPLGCRRKGRSRFWFSDQRFWLIGVEFQPSSWSKGSYLNVGASWLWYPKSYFSYDAGPFRIGQFERYDADDQFALVADRLASRAAEEVLNLQRKFQSIQDIASYLEQELHDNIGWSLYNTAVANGLAGKISVARGLFSRMTGEVIQHDYERERLAVAAELAQCLDDPSAYRAAVLRIVSRCRSLQRLAPDPSCIDSLA